MAEKHHENEPPSETPARTPNRLIAFLASLWLPGLGQLYNGEPGKAVGCLGLTAAAATLAFVSGPRWIDLGLAGAILVGVFLALVRLAIATEAARSAGWERPTRACNHWFVYVLVVLAANWGIGELRSLTTRLPLPVRSYYIPSGSMIPTLEPRDFILSDHTAYSDAEPQRFDIVVTRFPDGGETEYIKRVAGLPGETIEMIDGKLVVNGRQLDYPWQPVELEVKRMTVPTGTYFLLGDNINNSLDSRVRGPVPKAFIRGRVRVLFWPPSRARNFDEPVHPL